MKILFISQYAGTPRRGMVIRNYNWANNLASKGHRCTIIAASYSHYRTKNVEIGKNCFAKEEIDNVTYFWVKTATYNGESYIGRIWGMLTFHYRLRKLLNNLEKDYDVVIVSSPQPFQIFQAKAFSTECSAKLIYDIRDLWPLTPRKLGGFSKYHPFIIALQYAENFALKYADLVTTVPQNSKKYLVSKGLHPSKFLHIGNGYNPPEDPTSSKIPESVRVQLRTLKQEGNILIGYCGSLGLSNAMHTAISAISETQNKRIHLVIVGSGNKKEELMTMSMQLKVKHRIHFLTPIRTEQIPEFLTYIDATYAGTLKSSLYKYGASLTKINDYMAAAKPIIYAVGDRGNAIETSGCGTSCEAENVEAIAKAMDTLSTLSNFDLIEMGKKGYDWLYQHQTVDQQMRRVLEKLNEH